MTGTMLENVSVLVIFKTHVFMRSRGKKHYNDSFMLVEKGEALTQSAYMAITEADMLFI